MEALLMFSFTWLSSEYDYRLTDSKESMPLVDFIGDAVTMKGEITLPLIAGANPQ